MDLKELSAGVQSGQRRAISKALTLIESERNEDIQSSTELLRLIHVEKPLTRRIAVSGTPGVGKSSFIEMIGNLLLDQNKKIAVLAIDPSSPISGGSILGDKTRMEKLSLSENAFIRPTPNKGVLGGIARSSRDACEIFEAAGFDYIFIETVGVGQSETLAHFLVDCFVMLHLPNSGDELQGIKKGITELADIIVIHKADKDNLHHARAALSEHQQATHYYNKSIPIILVSSLENTGGGDFLREIDKFYESNDNTLPARVIEKRIKQSKEWLEEELKFRFIYELKHSTRYLSLLKSAQLEVSKNKSSVGVVASELFKKILKID